MTEHRATAPVAVIAGASWFIGRHVTAAFVADGYAVRVIGRDGNHANWNSPERIRTAVEGAAVFVNLAGRSVDCRYTDANREEILRSRLATTQALHEAVTAAARPPRVWLNASTATIYRYALERSQTEADGEFGEGFSLDVARS